MQVFTQNSLSEVTVGNINSAAAACQSQHEHRWPLCTLERPHAAPQLYCGLITGMITAELHDAGNTQIERSSSPAATSEGFLEGSLKSAITPRPTSAARRECITYCE
ncbi:uncharacterized protein LOC117259919 isoform X2 [Epinephelus lanceolatus]